MEISRQTPWIRRISRIYARCFQLIFLKFASDKFVAHQNKLIEEGKEKFADNVFFLRGIPVVIYHGKYEATRQKCVVALSMCSY